MLCTKFENHRPNDAVKKKSVHGPVFVHFPALGVVGLESSGPACIATTIISTLSSGELQHDTSTQ